MGLAELLRCGYLKAAYGRAGWHRRFYRSSVTVVRGNGRVWFEEGDRVFEAVPAASLAGGFSGRVNVLLSVPSVARLPDPGRLAEAPLVGVNGSPRLFGTEPPPLFGYVVNDTGYIRERTEDFLAFAGRVEWTFIDYRAVYLLLKKGISEIPGTRVAVFDNWSWPFRNRVGEIPRIARQPRRGEAVCSTDLSLGLANAGTVAFTTGQLLWHLGFGTAYFYGMDLNQSGRFYRETGALPQRLDKVFSRLIEPGFGLLAEYGGRDGFRMVNCSPDSRLPESVLPKMDPEASFDARETR